MKTLAHLRWAEPPLWKVTLANVLPLWLLSISFTTEGFPRPPVSPALGISAFLLAVAASIFLLWIKWLTPELILYSLFTFMFLFTFDEISTSYKTPFILLCTLLMMVGIVGYQLSLHKDSIGAGWFILVLAVIVTWQLASHANQNYWQMVGNLGFQCTPDSTGCTSLPANATPWWMLFFRS